MNIRPFEQTDAVAVSELIRNTIRISNVKDYPIELMERLIESQTPQHVIERASWTHFYVVQQQKKIIGCGAIGPYWGKEDESSLFTIFVLPEYQGKGIGRAIIDTLENDIYLYRLAVHPDYRRKGYATEMIRLSLLECKKLGIDKVLMVCDKSNIASAKTIIKNGGILENEFVDDDGEINQRYWIDVN